MSDKLKPLNHMGTKIIKTERLILRPFKMKDAADFFKVASDTEVTKYLSYKPHKNVNSTRKILIGWVMAYRSKEAYNWAIELNGKVVGTVGVISNSNKRYSCELGWQISRENWNKGYMTEAVNAVIDFLFGVVGYNRIYAGHDTRNIGSGRVMEKSGMTFEGIERQYAPVGDGNFADKRRMAILKEDWEKARK